MKNFQPLVSISIPTFNEEEDIRETLEACLKIRYPKKEIIVVDDSTDKTPLIVKEYKGRVRLIKREKNEGRRCGARNKGILESKGEILVILNADDLLPEDFIDRILEHYQNGADYVVVESEVINQEYLFARFVGALHYYDHRNPDWDWVESSEGFSCRKEVAIKSGLFPITPLSLVAGDDGCFGRKMAKKGYRKIIDRSIVVKHSAPHRFKEFWKIRKERVSCFNSYFLEKKSISLIFIRSIARSLITLIKFISVFPIFYMAFRISRYSPKKNKDVIPFVFAYSIQELAFLTGKWSSFFQLLKYIFSKK